MKRSAAWIMILCIAMACTSCKKDDPDQPGFNDITATDDISPYGGTLLVTDESGNLVKVTFPPGAVADTTTVTLTLLGKDLNLPVEERTVRAFEIKPSNLNLYVPAVISVEYKTAISEIQRTALFRVQSETWLTPLSGQNYSGDNKSVSATTLALGDFAEGEMTLDQVNTQVGLLLTAKSLTLKGAGGSMSLENRASSDCSAIKVAWDEWKDVTGGLRKFLDLRYVMGHYDDLQAGENTLAEEIALLCTNVLQTGINEVLDLGIPADPCCRDYSHTIVSMMASMNWYGCVENETYNRLNQRYNQLLVDCHSYLVIDTELSIESGGFTTVTSGTVSITAEPAGDGTSVVEGSGTLVVTGSGDAGGVCTATISGATSATATGIRDAASTFLLTISMNQNAVMTTVCPTGTVETPLIGGSARDVTLSPDNGFSVSVQEAVDGGTFSMEVTLSNPYTTLQNP